MVLLILGVLLWTGAHLFKRITPEARAKLGENAGKGLVTVALVISVVLMIVGYRSADFVPVWNPPGFMVHINNLLMVIAVLIFGTAHTKGRLRGWTRHPMLLSLKVWAVAHLLVNGDLASLILFGGLLAWAVVNLVLINKAAPEWTRPEPGPASKDVLLAIITLVTFIILAGIHVALGVWPFPA